MRTYLLTAAAALALTIASPALAADMPLKTGTPFAERFSWTSCYLGGHLGGGLGRNNITDPVQLVQDSFLGAGATTGVTTVSPNPTGVVIGAQIGCDYQFASSFVVGIEGAASGTTMKNTRSVALPLGAPDTALVKASTDFLASVTARVGYAFDNVLLYAKGGAALAGDRFDITGTFTLPPPTGFNFTGLDNRFGWTVGGGVDWAFSQHWSANLEYDYYDFGHSGVLMTDQVNAFAGVVNFRQTVQVVKAGVNFHIWGAGL
jgi:outer membrane immunogenic protein